MTLRTRICAALFLFTIAVPLVSSTAPRGPSSCQPNKEFWSSSNGCCLPVGGPPAPPPPPPKGTSCPPTSHYWGQKQGCCVPRHPPPSQAPPPQCSKGWSWNPTVRKCYPTPTPPSPPPSAPSRYPGNNNNGGGYHNNGGGYHNNGGGYHYRKRSSQKLRSLPLCPGGLDACPISGASSSDYECADTATDLTSCGGCASLGQGQDCTTIVGAWNVGCEQSHCEVYTCAGGFKRSPDGRSCIPN